MSHPVPVRVNLKVGPNVVQIVLTSPTQHMTSKTLFRVIVASKFFARASRRGILVKQNNYINGDIFVNPPWIKKWESAAAMPTCTSS